MRQIVVAIDGSEFSRQALSWAQELGKSAGQTLFHLVHAYGVEIPIAASVHSFAHMRERGREAAMALLEEARARLTGHRAEVHLVEERPSRAVLDVAAKVGADLIAVGRRGRDPATSLFLGSVSAEILHHSHAPVLVVHDAPPRSMQAILVGVDDSDHSARALAFAAAWAPTAQVTALHVVPGGAESAEAVGQSALHVVRRTADRAGLSPERLRVLGLPGNPVEAVVHEFRRGEYDLAVVGSRGLGTMGELLLGSVSERLSRLAQGAVVVVK